MNREPISTALVALCELVERLRGPGGCPWDAQQTESTVRMYLLEEAYEVLDAVERGSPKEVCQELGDLLFQILFLCRLAEEKGQFGLPEVLEAIHRKMIIRHPHVFGTATVESAEEVAENWQKIKEKERGESGEAPSLHESVPVNLPALLRAHRLYERLSQAFPEEQGGEIVWQRVEEHFEQVRRCIASREGGEIEEELGALLFDVAALARVRGLNAEHLLRSANQRFLERTSKGKTPFPPLGKWKEEEGSPGKTKMPSDGEGA